MLKLLLASLIIISLVVITQQAQAQPTQKTYTDPQGFYTLQYPSNWSVKYVAPISRLDNPEISLYVNNNTLSPINIAIKNTSVSEDDLKTLLDELISTYGIKYTVSNSGFDIYKISGH